MSKPGEPSRASGDECMSADAVTIAIVLGVTVLVGAAPTLRRWLAPRADRRQCEALVDRWAEHVAFTADPAAQGAERERVKLVVLGSPEVAPAAVGPGSVSGSPRTARFEPRASRVARCARDVLAAEATCALAASGLDAFERCAR